MNMFTIKTLPLLSAACLLPWIQGQGDNTTQEGAKFANPQRIQTGDSYLGEGRLYPSPVMRDMDGDGLPDIVIGDLFGKVTVATRLASTDKTVRWEKDKGITTRDGAPLKFHNW